MMGILAAVEGVCDTPLHLFDYFMGNMMVERWASSPPWRAYAIRPYTYSIFSWVTCWLNDGHPRRRGGRMRYAPTLVRQFHR